MIRYEIPDVSINLKFVGTLISPFCVKFRTDFTPISCCQYILHIPMNQVFYIDNCNHSVMSGLDFYVKLA